MKNTLFYREVYDRIIYRAKTREPLTGYVERHHIMPRCMGGSDDADNMVTLTPEEHYVCHQLLVKLHPTHVGLRRAVYMMSYVSGSTQGRASNKLYGWLKRKNKWKPRIVSNCKTCNKEMVVLACFNRKYCSKRCMYDRLYKEKVRKCKQCKNDFIVPRIRKDQTFCSPKCSSASQVKIVSKCCKFCSKEFFDAPWKISLKKFCSLTCVSLSRKGKSRVVPERVPITSKPCGHCGKLIYGKPGVLKQMKNCRPTCKTRRHVNDSSTYTS